MKNLSSHPHDWGLFTVLSVSNHSDDRQTLIDLIPKDQFRVKCVASCQEALRCLHAVEPAVIACDDHLPDGSWRDILARISEVQEAPPLIVMARHADERLWAEVLNLGGYDVLAKPLERTEVHRVMRMACRFGNVAVTA